MEKLRKQLAAIVAFNRLNADVLRKDYGVTVQVYPSALSLQYWSNYSDQTVGAQTSISYLYEFDDLGMPETQNLILRRIAADAIVGYLADVIELRMHVSSKVTLPQVVMVESMPKDSIAVNGLLIAPDDFYTTLQGWGKQTKEAKIVRKKARSMPCTDFVAWVRTVYAIERQEATKWYDAIMEEDDND